MRTIYITGAGHFRKVVRKALDKSNLIEGKDYIEGNTLTKEYSLYWINKNVLLRQFKISISAKYIWRNRLRFFNTIDEISPATTVSDLFTESELELMEQFRHPLN